MLAADCVRWIVWRVGREGSGGIVCWQQIVLEGLLRVWEGKGLGNCVLTADCVRGI